MRAALRQLACLVLLAALALAAVGGPAAAQTGLRSWVPGGGAANMPDYAAWEVLARTVENAVADARTTSLALEQLRARVVEWRSRFLEAQSANQARIETLRGQLRALGPPPEEGASEAPEIAERRQELNDQLARLQAPIVAAEEAFRRADGLIREIDRTLRERQADALMQLSPSPLNPANWPVAALELHAVTTALAREIRSALALQSRRDALNDNLPIIAAYLLFAFLLLYRGRRWVETLTLRLQEGATARRQSILALLISVGQVLVPLAGVLALVEAIRASGLVGLRGQPLVEALAAAGLTLLLARWLGGQIFPKGDVADPPLNLSPERRREGRFHAAMLGLVLALDRLRAALFEPVAPNEAAEAVVSFPFLLLGGLLVFRLGQLMRQHVLAEREGEASLAYSDRLIGLGGRLMLAIGLVAPVLAGIGYVAAAGALVYPAAVSLGLVGLLMLLQRLVAEAYALIMGGDAIHRDALVPTLAGFGMVLVSLPVFALVWGVRESELHELWTLARDGFSVGDSRIAPADFITVVVVFVVGYMLTRLVQGALRSSVLPKTKIEKGAQNAVVSGLGYVGIFLAALIAFTSAGIDLSNLAIVAGALSVGIGFGLQTVVSNFVSGIILLFERPVAEGDWIEVGGVMGTVRKISVRSTVIETFDRTDVIVPNADLITGQVTNWTRYNLTGRLIVKVAVAYGTDTRKVEQILYEIAEAQPLVVLNPKPNVLLRSFGADGLEFEIRVILRDVNFLLRVNSDINHEIVRRFIAEGIEIPFSQRDIWLRNPEDLRRALEPVPRPPEAEGGPPAPLKEMRA